MISDRDVLNKGMACLVNELGVVETEQFISYIIREKFNYTEWRRDKFDNMRVEELNMAAVNYTREYPFLEKEEMDLEI